MIARHAPFWARAYDGPRLWHWWPTPESPHIGLRAPGAAERRKYPPASYAKICRSCWEAYRDGRGMPLGPPVYVADLVAGAYHNRGCHNLYHRGNRPHRVPGLYALARGMRPCRNCKPEVLHA